MSLLCNKPQSPLKEETAGEAQNCFSHSSLWDMTLRPTYVWTVARQNTFVTSSVDFGEIISGLGLKLIRKNNLKYNFYNVTIPSQTLSFTYHIKLISLPHFHSIQLRVAGGVQSITGPQSDRRDKQPATFTLTPRVNLESPINLTCLFVGNGRNLLQ